MSETRIRKTCPQGHIFYKSSDCNSCPKCNANKEDFPEYMRSLPSPVRRALVSHHIDTPSRLSSYRAEEILSLHGIGSKSLPLLRQILEKHDLRFQGE